MSPFPGTSAASEVSLGESALHDASSPSLTATDYNFILHFPISIDSRATPSVLPGANFECKRNAAQAGIRGAFQAFLATSYQNLNEIVRHNSHVQKYPIVNMRVSSPSPVSSNLQPTRPKD